MESQPWAGSSALPEPGSPHPVTGDRRVDEAIGPLAALGGLPVVEHPAVFEHVHRRLTEALGDLDARDRPGAEDGPGQPGG